MKRFVLALSALSLLAGPTAAFAKQCRDKQGHFIKCPKQCRDAKGHYTKCK